MYIIYMYIHTYRLIDVCVSVCLRVCVYKSINVCTGESTKLLGDNVNTILAG